MKTLASKRGVNVNFKFKIHNTVKYLATTKNDFLLQKLDIISSGLIIHVFKNNPIVWIKKPPFNKKCAYGQIMKPHQISLKKW